MEEEEWDDRPEVIEAIKVAFVGGQSQSEDGIIWDESPAVIEALQSVGVRYNPGCVDAIRSVESQNRSDLDDLIWDESPQVMEAIQSVTVNATSELDKNREALAVSASENILSHRLITVQRSGELNRLTQLASRLLADVSFRSEIEGLDNKALFILLTTWTGPGNLNVVQECLDASRVKLAHSTRSPSVEQFRNLGFPQSLEQRFVHRNVQADGNCFYRAAAVALLGDENLHAIVRVACLWALSVWNKTAIKFAKRVMSNECTIGQLIHSTASEGSWSTAVSQLLLSAACKRRVITLSPFTRQHMVIYGNGSFDDICDAASAGNLEYSANAFLAFDDDRYREPLYLYFNRFNHYTGILKSFHNSRDLWVKAYAVRL